MDPRRLRLVRNIIRLVWTLGAAGVVLWAGNEAREEFAREGAVEGLKLWVLGIGLGLGLAWWAPWRAFRIAAAACLLLVLANIALLGLFILAGGPDSRSGPPGALVVALLVVLLVLCLPIVLFIFCELRLARRERSP